MSISPGVDTYLSTEVHVASLRRHPRRRYCIWVGRPEMFPLSYTASYKSTKVYTSFTYNAFSCHWTIVDRVLQYHNGRARINNGPDFDGHFLQPNFPGLRIETLGKADSPLKIMVVAYACKPPEYILPLHERPKF